jgi:hypothetical protein
MLLTSRLWIAKRRPKGAINAADASRAISGARKTAIRQLSELERSDASNKRRHS